AELGRPVVGLAEVAEQPAGGGGDDDPAITLLTEMRPSGADDVVPAVKVHLEHGIPVLERHLVEGAVAQDPGIAHHTVHGAELVDCGLDDAGRAVFGGDAVIVGGRTTTRVANLGDDVVGHRRSGAGPVAGAAEVVDYDAGAFPGEGKGVFAAQPS